MASTVSRRALIARRDSATAPAETPADAAPAVRGPSITSVTDESGVTRDFFTRIPPRGPEPVHVDYPQGFANSHLDDDPKSAQGPVLADLSFDEDKVNDAYRNTGVARLPLAAAVPAPPAVDAALHLARRATWGYTPELLAEIRAKGTTAWLDEQLDPQRRCPDPDGDRYFAEVVDPRVLMSPAHLKSLSHPNSSGAARDAVRYTHVGMGLWSSRQLFEVMNDFWYQYIPVNNSDGRVWYTAHDYYMNVVRKHSLGRFSDLLLAATFHPAYITLWELQSSNGLAQQNGPNESFARELLDNVTLGRGNFTEADVLGAARALTGICINTEGGTCEYRPFRHYIGAVKVGTWSDKNPDPDGRLVARSLLLHLARHRKTAENLATRLCQRFVSDDAPATLVKKLADVYQANDTAIAPVLKALFTSTEFAASTGQKIKTPLEAVMATTRVLGFKWNPASTDLTWTQRLVANTYAGNGGMVPLASSAPWGYPDRASAWSAVKNIQTVWNWNYTAPLYTTTSQRHIEYKSLPDRMWGGAVPKTYQALMDHLSVRLIGHKLSTAKVATLCDVYSKKPTDVVKTTDVIYQNTTYLGRVVAMILDAPEAALR